MAKHLERIAINNFNMATFRTPKDYENQECGYVGCILGHCIMLDDPKNIPRSKSKIIKFYTWSENFTGIEAMSDEWTWLFGSHWEYVDNTPYGGAKRIRHFINHGLPEDWKLQMLGERPLIYNQ